MSFPKLDSLTLVSAAAAFGLVIALWAVFVVLWARRRAKHEELVQQRLDPVGRARMQQRTLRLWHDGDEATITVEDEEARTTLRDRLAQMRKDAGFKAPIETLLLLAIAFSLAAAVAMFIVTQSVIPALMAAVTVLALLWWYLGVRIIKRVDLFERQLVDALELSARALRSGHPLLGAFQLISDEVPAPVGAMFGEICQQQAMGVPLEDALRRASNLTKSADMKLFAASLAINMRTGGNLADVMQGIAYVIRERMRLGRRFRVLIAQTQISKRILIAMPFVMFLALNLIGPRYMRVLYATPSGNLLLLVASLGLLIGWLVMNKMANLRV